jgi:L-histidine Nalpha-methyltransferase
MTTSHNTLVAAFRRDVISGLSTRPRTVPARWFYDQRGSELFEAITNLPEYYPTRTERAILETAAPEIARLAGPARAIVEFGSGSSAKTPILLSALAPSAYVPMDISGDFLRLSAQLMRSQFPRLPVHELAGDFTKPFALPSAVDGSARLGFFPGSTIGNFLVPQAVDLLRAFGRTLGNGAMLLIGLDRIKDRHTLLAAYDDAEGVTARFNLNLLHRMNRELGASIPIEAFRHRVLWNEAESRIEMHLEARREVSFQIEGRAFTMTAGETIHTENSLKYGERDARVLLRAGGWTPIGEWTDREEHFSVLLAKRKGPSWSL